MLIPYTHGHHRKCLVRNLCPSHAGGFDPLFGVIVADGGPLTFKYTSLLSRWQHRGLELTTQNNIHK